MERGLIRWMVVTRKPVLRCRDVRAREANTQTIQNAILVVHAAPCRGSALVGHGATVEHIDGITLVALNTCVDRNGVVHCIDVIRSYARC